MFYVLFKYTHCCRRGKHLIEAHQGVFVSTYFHNQVLRIVCREHSACRVWKLSTLFWRVCFRIGHHMNTMRGLKADVGGSASGNSLSFMCNGHWKVILYFFYVHAKRSSYDVNQCNVHCEYQWKHWFMYILLGDNHYPLSGKPGNLIECLFQNFCDIVECFH